ncbi:GLRA2-like protein [Mya arenaria]|uniref:GLRA2-like protein n=1 Tax=Mya arenaria TaxID=6604 RepID=A0ABY7DSF6_MYAAR|nr:GLRA2-like protein [Mya arenaria]
MLFAIIQNTLFSSLISAEVFSTLSVDFVLKRKIGLYFMQVFVPSLLFVVLSWVSFWVDHKAVPARVSLGITCVLAIVTQSSGIHHVLPNVSYPTAIDIWMLVCQLYVFAALLEFAIVNVLDKCHVQGNAERAQRVDVISRLVFPATFVLFTCIFFIVVESKNDSMNYENLFTTEAN